MNVGMFSNSLGNRPDAEDHGLQCTLTFKDPASKGIKKVVCDTMTLASPIEGVPDGLWDEFKTTITQEGDETGGWEFEVEFDSENFDLATYKVLLPGDTLFVFYDTQTSEDWHYYQAFMPSIGYKATLDTDCEIEAFSKTLGVFSLFLISLF